MNVPALLVRLYPPAIRQCWGSEIVNEARLAGPRSWFDTVAGAGKLWLHPSDWPETTTGQTRRVLATALVAVTTMAALLVRAASPDPLTGNVEHPVTSGWLAPILLGLALAAPLPPINRASAPRLARTAARTLLAPTIALLALVLLANSGLVQHPTGVLNTLLLCGYWTVLGFAGFHLCLLMARIGRIAILPSMRRLCLALLLVGTGLALGAAQALAATVHTGSVLLAGELVALATAILTAGLDLRRVPPGGARRVAEESPR